MLPFRARSLTIGIEATNGPDVQETRSDLFQVEAVAEGEGARLSVAGPGGRARLPLPGGEQEDYPAFFAPWPRDFGTRVPARLRRRLAPAPKARSRLAAADHRESHRADLAGYGDPAVLKTDEGYVLVATSNDAPDAFPILRSRRPRALGA